MIKNCSTLGMIFDTVPLDVDLNLSDFTSWARDQGHACWTRNQSCASREVAYQEREAVSRLTASTCLSGGPARCPRPLEVEAAEVSGHVHHLADEVQSWHLLR